MDNQKFRKKAHELVDWIADYYQNIEQYPVKPSIDPGTVKQNLPNDPPQKPESFNQIISDFRQKIIPGMTHWQHPRFMGYFPANTSYPSILAEFLTAALGAQCMSWQTSPAATELEDIIMIWLRKMLQLPENMEGVIQDTASTSTLVALLMARENTSDMNINEEGFAAQSSDLCVYGSRQTHSSIEKGAKIAGFGRRNVRKIPVDHSYAMKPDALRKAIRKDRDNGMKPCCVVATLGTTGTTAIDPLADIARVCRDEKVWLHVDAAFAGTALLLPEKRCMLEGIEQVNSFVFNPHKWMFTNFDCSAFFVKDSDHLERVFSILPEYLKTKEDDKVNNYRDWGIQLGRRFRALKLWFVIRTFGVEGLQKRIRHHINLAQEVRETIETSDHFELMAPVPFNAICFRYNPSSLPDTDAPQNEEALNRWNRQLLETIQDEGFVFMTHTTLDDQYTLRMVIGQTNVTEQHVWDTWNYIRQKTRELFG